MVNVVGNVRELQGAGRANALGLGPEALQGARGPAGPQPATREGGFGADGAEVSPEAQQEGAAANNKPEMRQQMQQAMNDARLTAEVQAVHQAQAAAQAAAQKAQQGQQQGGDAQQDPNAGQDQVAAAMQQLGQDYQNIKQNGGAISPQVEKLVQQTLGVGGQQNGDQQDQQKAQGAGQGQENGGPQGGQDAGGNGQPGGGEQPQAAGGPGGGEQPQAVGAPGGGAPGGGPGAGGPRGTGGAGEAAGAPDTATVSPPPELQGNDQRMADFINKYLQDQRSPAANQHAGEMMVKYGKQYKVDPMALLAVAGHETQFGKTGIGVRGMLGVGAYDANPRNAVNNPGFSGVENQIRRGAQTFAKLRARGGSGPNDAMGRQLAAVNRGGWATDRNWHNGVSAMYNKVSRAANQYNQTHPVA
ncbi:MAG: hypothetical protein EB084_08695, partial [Proteobacteria bacterium]|nr:hypothetical protein [Pseudomonadota bacterium]